MDVSSAARDSGLPERAESRCARSAIRPVCAMQEEKGRGPVVDSKASWEDMGGGLLGATSHVGIRLK